MHLDIPDLVFFVDLGGVDKAFIQLSEPAVEGIAAG